MGIVLRVVVVGAVMLGSVRGEAAVTCSTGYTPPPVLTPGKESAKCQATIAREASKYANLRVERLSECMQLQQPGLCPRADDTTALETAANDAAAKIEKACAGKQAALASLYKDVGTPNEIASCTLSQHVATTTVILGNNNGTPGKIVENEARDECAEELSVNGTKYLKGALAAMNRCFVKQTKKGAGADASAACIGSWGVGTAFVPPTDGKTAKALAKLEAKASKKIAKKCDLTDPVATIESLFACPGALTVGDLQACIVCENRRGAAELFVQQNGESAKVLADGSATLQSLEDAAADGDKILILPGTYKESMVISTPRLQLVGCGAAVNDRPSIEPPDVPDPADNGVFASGVDGLVFQSLRLFNWSENGIFVQGADGVTFRDVIGDGNNESVYAIYPVESTNVVVEGCLARRIRDAGIYVGQAVGVVVRYNTCELNVAGMEIENSSGAKVYGNFMTANTGGLLVFKLPGPALQISENHEVFDNVSNANNTASFAAPNTAVGTIPDGTGILVLSNDTTDFHHNIAEDNGTFGLALIDQRAVNLLSPGAFDPESPDQKTEGNLVRDNLFRRNGTDPDLDGPNGVIAEIATGLFYLLGEPTGAENCFRDNTVLDGPAPVGIDSSVCP